MGLPRNLRPGRRPSAGKSRSAAAGQRITVDDLLQFAQIRLKLKNEGELVEVVQLLLKLGCHVVPGQCALPQANKAFDATGKLLDARAEKSVRDVTAALVRLAGALKK